MNKLGRLLFQRSRRMPGVLLMLTLAVPVFSAEPVFISECLAANDGGLLDEDFQSSDWIEICNSGDAAVNLAVQFQTNITSNPWLFLSNVVVQSLVRSALVAGPNRPTNTARFYRVMTP